MTDPDAMHLIRVLLHGPQSRRRLKQPCCLASAKYIPALLSRLSATMFCNAPAVKRRQGRITAATRAGEGPLEPIQAKPHVTRRRRAAEDNIPVQLQRISKLIGPTVRMATALRMCPKKFMIEVYNNTAEGPASHRMRNCLHCLHDALPRTRVVQA
jgi:hypothetical protein